MTKKTVNIFAVGDIFLGEHPYTLNHGVVSKVREKGCLFLFSKINNYLKGGDIVCGNLEGIISQKNDSETGIKSAIFWGEPECAQILKETGFNCLFLANNHTAQHGIDALQRTCKILDQNNIHWTGFNPDDISSSKPAELSVGGLRVGLLSYCETQQYHLNSRILPSIDLENIKRDINALRNRCNIVIVSLHWGDEFILYPSPDQVRLAHEIIDAGALLILGHHSHTVQGLERYKNGLIAYSLGSFVKDLWLLNLRETIILKCELSENGLENFTIVPVIINDEYQPEYYNGENGKLFIKRIHSLSNEVEQYNFIDYRSMQNKYEKEVKYLRKKDKIETAMHYIANIYRYDKKLLLENILLMARRRISRKNI